DPVRVALEHAAVHESAGVALVGVADDVLVLPLVLGDRPPLQPRGIPGATPAPQAAAGDGVDHLRGIHLSNYFVERAIAAGRDVRFDALGLDRAAILQHDRLLAGEERPAGITPPGGHRAAVQSGHDRGRLVGTDPFVKDALGIELDQGALATEPHAAHGAHLDRGAQARALDSLLQPLLHVKSTRREAAGRRADANPDRLARRQLLLADLLELSQVHVAAILSSAPRQGRARRCRRPRHRRPRPAPGRRRPGTWRSRPTRTDRFPRIPGSPRPRTRERWPAASLPPSRSRRYPCKQRRYEHPWGRR